MGKLIRSNYQFIIESEKWKKITPGSPEHFDLLEDKLSEEFAELKESEFESLEEYADLVEVIHSIAILKGIKWNDIMHEGEEKGINLGNFTDGIILTE